MGGGKRPEQEGRQGLRTEGVVRFQGFSTEWIILSRLVDGLLGISSTVKTIRRWQQRREGGRGQAPRLGNFANLRRIVSVERVLWWTNSIVHFPHTAPQVHLLPIHSSGGPLEVFLLLKRIYRPQKSLTKSQNYPPRSARKRRPTL